MISRWIDLVRADRRSEAERHLARVSRGRPSRLTERGDLGWVGSVDVSAPVCERVRLADGIAAQTLISGVAPVSESVRDIARERARREALRRSGTMPSGGLFDFEGRAQQDLF